MFFRRIFDSIRPATCDLAKRLFRRFANSHARVAEQQFRAAYSIIPAGAFAKNLFIFHFFKVIFGGRNAAELLFFIVFRRQRFSHACRIRIIQLLQLFPIGLYGFAVVFVSERSVREIGSDFRPHRLPVGEKCRTRKTAFPTFCEQPCACCDSNSFARRIQSLLRVLSQKIFLSFTFSK